MAKQKQTNKTNNIPGRPPVVTTPPPQSRPKTTSESKGVTDRTLIIILIAIAFIVNIRTTSYSYTYDDTVFTTEQSYIGLKGLGAIPGLFTHAKNYNYDKSNTGSYRPLLPITFAIEHEVFGFKPAVSHFINLILFSLMILVLFKLLRRMFADQSMYIPFFILLLFELHPVHTEVVANVKSRDELLTFMFTAMSMLQSFKYIDNNKAKHLLLSGVYFLIALLAKESPVPFVVLVPLTLYFFTNGSLKNILISAVPYIISTAIFVGLGLAFLDKAPKAAGAVAITENALVDASTMERLGTAFFIQLKYIGLLLFPHPLSFDYSFNQIPLIGVFNIKAIISLVVLLALLAYAFMGLKKKSVYSYGILYYFIVMSITSNIFIVIGTTMGERLLFISSLGFCIVVVFLLAKLFKNDTATLTYSNASKFSYVIIGICVLYAGKTMARNEDWKNNFELFQSGVEVVPNSWRAQYCLGAEYKIKVLAETNPVEKNRLIKEAIKYFNNSLAIYPNKADTHGDLGAIYLTAQQNDSAILHLKRAVDLNPKLSSAAANLGTVYLTLQNYGAAAIYYRQTIEVDPNNVTAVFNKAVCDVQFKRYDSAVYNFKRAMEIQPQYNNYKAVEYTAIVFKMMGRIDSAAKYMAIAKRTNPAFSM
ncbi:MAG: tetratricopeptide repeat protein [Flavipsychrobacter sp.]|nr:tetratricopeptide repeat protein [Flavipsychrobacter sp.]